VYQRSVRPCCAARYLVSLNTIKPMCDLLTVMDSKIVQVALNGLENILRLGEQEAKQSATGINPYCALIEEAYGTRGQTDRQTDRRADRHTDRERDRQTH